MKSEIETALQNLRAECARAIEMDNWVGQHWKVRHTHSGRASRALLMAVDVLEKIAPYEIYDQVQYWPGRKAIKALAAIAAEFPNSGLTATPKETE